MTLDWLIRMVPLSLTDPRKAAAGLLALDLGRDALWMVLLLVSVLQTFIYALVPGALILPEPLSAIKDNPVYLAFMVTGMVILTTQFLTWIGNAIGGKGRLTDLLAVTAWIQVLRLLATLAVLVVGSLSPGLGGLLGLGLSIAELIIFVTFLDAAHGFGNRLKALFLLVLTLVAVAFGTSFIVAIAHGLFFG